MGRIDDEVGRDGRDRLPVLGRRPRGAYRRLSYGLYLPVSGDGSTGQVGRLAAWQLALPETGCFTHLTAASILGWWVPPGQVDLPVFAAVPQAGTRPRRAGLRVVRYADPPRFSVLPSGLKVAEPSDVLLTCARHLRLLDLVALCDSALHLGHCSLPELQTVAGARRPGAPALRRALRFLDGRAESGWESLLRLLHVLCGIDVEPQYVVRDASGVFVARADLLLSGTRMLHEVDGGDHRRPARQRRDLDRDRRLLAAGWARRGYPSLDVLTRGTSILRDADAAIGRRHDPARIRRWHRHLSQSLVTPAGQSRFRRLLGLPTERPARVG